MTHAQTIAEQAEREARERHGPLWIIRRRNDSGAAELVQHVRAHSMGLALERTFLGLNVPAEDYGLYTAEQVEQGEAGS